MSWYNFDAAEVLSDTNLENKVMKQQGKPFVVVHRTGTQSIANNTDVAIQWDAEDLDTDTMHDNSTNNTRLTATTAGYYRVHANYGAAGNATGTRDIFFRVNGSGTTPYKAREIPGTGTADAYVSSGGPLHVALSASDYVEVMVRQTSGGALNTTGANTMHAALEWVSMP